MKHPTDNRVHFSQLKHMADSPAHYRHACETATQSTRAMTVGSIGDAIVFDRADRIAVYPGVRRGKEWEAFQRANADKLICIQSEYDDASGAALAIRSDPIASGILRACQHQIVVQWEAMGIPCATGLTGERGGIDAIDLATGDIWDVKITVDTEPESLTRQAWRQKWHAQLAWMIDGWNAADKLVDTTAPMHATRGGIIACESAPPHVVTVLRCTPAALESGRKSIRLWLERLIACESANVWPGYLQTIGELDVPEWAMDEE